MKPIPDDGIVQVVETLAVRGWGDCGRPGSQISGEPFQMPVLMAKAEKVEKLTAICMVCGEAATRTQRLINNEPARYDDDIIVVGAEEMYEARCRKHHIVIRD